MRKGASRQSVLSIRRITNARRLGKSRLRHAVAKPKKRVTADALVRATARIRIDRSCRQSVGDQSRMLFVSRTAPTVRR